MDLKHWFEDNVKATETSVLLVMRAQIAKYQDEDEPKLAIIDAELARRKKQ